MMNLLEPWILVRLVAGLVATLLFARGAWTASRVVRHFDVSRATEGQLALEKQSELAATFVRVGAAVQVGALVLSVLAAERLSHGIRGAMCAYGVFAASPLGFPALFVTLGVALAAGVLAQLYAFDARVRGMDLVRPLAIAALGFAPLVAIDLFVTARFLLGLDLSVVASCCSVSLDEGASRASAYASGPRGLVATLAPAFVTATLAAALLVSRKPTARRAVLVGAMTALSFPFAVAASVLYVAPHAFEVPHHLCPFCLLKSDVLGMGYPLFGAIFLATVWGLGTAVSGLFAATSSVESAFAPFARRALVHQALAWGVALAVGLAPVVRYAIVTGGASLFR